MHRLGLVLFGLLLTVVASPSVAQPGFERGVETARDDPAVLVNLGRAHAQADHFLSAIAYFEAYLAAASQPPAGLREQLAALYTLEEARWRGVIAHALEIAASIEDGEERGANLEEIVLMQARLGDIEGALSKLPESASAWRRRSVWFEFAIARAAAGDVKAAIAAADRIGDRNQANEVHHELYRYWLAVGNWAGARTEAEAHDPDAFWGDERDGYFARIAERRARGADGLLGNITASQKWLEIADTSFPTGALWGRLASRRGEATPQGTHPDRDLQGALHEAEAAPTPQEKVLRLVSTEHSVLDHIAYARMAVRRLGNGLAWREANPDWKTRD